MPAAPARIVFGDGASADFGEWVDELGCRRALVLSTPQQADDAEALAGRLGALAAGTFAGAAMHTPVEVTAGGARARWTRAKADCVVSLGGGSTTGLGKAIAYRTDLPQIVIPTTYAGSEVDVDPRPDREGREDHAARPAACCRKSSSTIRELTLGLPVAMSVTSGLNAMAHAAEALYAEDRNPITTLMAVEGLRALRSALPAIVQTPRDLGCPRRGALRRLALRHGARRRRHGAAPQDLPHARRQLRPAARRNARDHAAAHDRLQRGGGARSARSGVRHLRRPRPARRSTTSPGSIGAPTALCATRSVAKPTSTAPPTSPREAPTRIRADRPAIHPGAAAGRVGRQTPTELITSQLGGTTMITRRTLAEKRRRNRRARRHVRSCDARHRPGRRRSSSAMSARRPVRSRPSPRPTTSSSTASSSRGKSAGMNYRGHRQGQPVQPEPRRRGRQGTDRRRRDRPDAGRLHAGDHKPGLDHLRDRRVPCLSTVAPWQPWFIGQQGNPGDPSTWQPFDYAYHFFWGLEDVIAVFTNMWGAARDQQERRRPVPE